MSRVRYTVRLQGLTVGHSELEQLDRARRLARGPFRPGLGYELVEPIFQLGAGERGDDAGQAERYERARAALALELVDATGHRLATQAIHVRDEGGALVLEVELDDPEFWRGRE